MPPGAGAGGGATVAFADFDSICSAGYGDFFENLSR